MRECWNWQTGTFEGVWAKLVRVQVPPLTILGSGEASLFFSTKALEINITYVIIITDKCRKG